MKSLCLILTICAAGLAYGQGASEEARLRVLNGQAVSLLARYQRGDAAAKAQARAEAATLLAERRAALDALIGANAKSALGLAFAADLLADLRAAFPASAADIESRGEWRGKLEYIIQDGTTPASTKEIYRLHGTTGRPANLIPAGRLSGDLKCNDTLAAAGVKSGDTIVASTTTLVEAANAICSTTGPQKIAVIVVNMPGYTVADPTETEIRGIFLGNAASGEAISPDRHVSDFWYKNSDAKTWVNTAAPGEFRIIPVTLAQNMAYCSCDANGNCSDNSGAMRQAAYAAADPLINYADYSRIALVVPHNGTCNGIAGVASIGCWSSEAPGDGQSNVSWTWLRADQTNSRNNGVMLVTHEMGHNQTMSHAGSRDHGAEVIGPIGTAGTRSEYGDGFGTMGSWNFGPYNAHHLVSRAGWMNASNYIDVTQTGVYSIPAFDTMGGAVKALRVKRGTTATNAWFWVAYYPSTGLYLAPLGDQIHSGAIIHAQDPATPSGKTDLLDFTPASTGNHSDPALAVGQCWQDPYTDVQICATSITNGLLNVTVNYSLPPCTNADPTVAFNDLDLAKTVAAGTAATFRVNVTNNDSTTCASRTFTMSSASPSGAGWTTSFNTTPTLAPGASTEVTMTKTPATSVAGGTYSVTATASAAFNSGASGTSTATTNPAAGLTVTEPAPSAPAAPSSVTVTVATTGSGKTKQFQSFTVRWLDNSSNETNFDITRCRVSGKGGTATCTADGWNATVGANLTSLTDGVKPAAGTYRFSVKSRNSIGSSVWVSSANVTIP